MRVTSKSEIKQQNYSRRVMQTGRFYDPETKLSVDPQTYMIKKII